MRTLDMYELSVVAGGDITLPTVTITYNTATGLTSYSGASAGTGGAGPNNASALIFGSQINKDQIEAELQLATAVLAIGAAVTYAFPPISAVLALGAIATGASAFAVSKAPQP